MADFKSNMTSLSEVSDSIRVVYDTQFLISSADQGSTEQFASVRKGAPGSSVKFPKYGNIALATTPLTDKEEATPVAISDSQITLSPVEYGAVVTDTQIAEIQSGGALGLAKAKLVGENMGRTMNKLAIEALEAGSNELFGGDAGSEGALDSSDVMSVSLLQKLYNKLARNGVAPLSDGLYVAIMHDDVLYDLRNSAGSGSFQDIGKYQHSEKILRNEVGMLAGFRIIRDSNISINSDAGASTVDSYHTLCLGFNALGKAVSKEPEMKILPGYDNLGRFANLGWHAIVKYGIVDSDAVWKGTTASSVGAN